MTRTQAIGINTEKKYRSNRKQKWKSNKKHEKHITGF